MEKAESKEDVDISLTYWHQYMDKEKREYALEKLNDEQLALNVPIILYISVCMTLGTLGNSAVVYIFYRKMRKTATNFFVAALGICDLVCCTIYMPVDIISLRYSMTFYSEFLCHLENFSFAIGTIYASEIIFCIVVERYLRVCQPFRKHISRRLALKMMPFMFLISFLLSIPAVWVFGKRTIWTGMYGITVEICSYDEDNIHEVYPLYYYCTLLSLNLLVFNILMVLYYRIGLCVWRYKKRRMKELQKINEGPRDPSEEEVNDAQDNVSVHHVTMKPYKIDQLNEAFKEKEKLIKKTNIVFFIVSLVWIISYLPHYIATLWTIVHRQGVSPESKSYVPYEIAIRSYFMSCVANPFIYGLLNIRFRRELCKLFEKIFRRDSFY
ncbi:cholecystokinin receptor type A [Octopus bimaculoides]|uniref:G-protein coupled receptors family 1 profile domain-containing protein n=1 Tax=Octopus bimaculoides TaxID=37653 RepID=A0A0L8HXV7_OCTBM|nr:cholecystokinin receptor type A [Octopus bimaculoides]|eukprot:XP_014768522.1 PREDICTED: cholecystokinin receptor type A-like [Octopus bimaculoides]